VHISMKDVAQLWVSGLVTDKEITCSFRNFAQLLDSLDLANHIDPATGLRYPTT
jgi:hypothetical protein